ncbi:hypothetical protein CASFOL_016082 [Castilleja foliolosa]|uniref:Uncharacterized protein n=1 Tax=Castilleja foliolosa TaxID=1961234 RepID=A0ABD3DGY8_9LAMI
MPATDYQESSSSSSQSSLRFPILSRRRDQVHSMDPTRQESELDAFQRQVADRFNDLAAVNSGELLSIDWIRKLLDTFLCCQEQFKVIILNNSTNLSKPPIDKHISDFFERSIKALDVCNAIRDGIDQIRQWQKLLEIVLCAFDYKNINNNQRSIGEGQFRRAKKALVDLALAMLDEKESKPTAIANRNRSFGRQQKESSARSLGHFRSMSWSVSRSWSAARQLQAISNNLVGPRPNETISTNGLNVAVFTMNYVLLFVMWALVAAIPCQDRGLQTHFFVTRQFVWAGPILSLHERILEESKRRDRRNVCGLLREIRDVERCARIMNELTDFVNFPLTEEKEREVRSRVREVGFVYEGVKEGLDPLERLVREVFRRIVRIRTDGLDSIAQGN